MAVCTEGWLRTGIPAILTAIVLIASTAPTAKVEQTDEISAWLNLFDRCRVAIERYTELDDEGLALFKESERANFDARYWTSPGHQVMVEMREKFRSGGVNRMCLVKRYSGPDRASAGEPDELRTAFVEHLAIIAEAEEELVTANDDDGSFWGVLKRENHNPKGCEVRWGIVHWKRSGRHEIYATEMAQPECAGAPFFARQK